MTAECRKFAAKCMKFAAECMTLAADCMNLAAVETVFNDFNPGNFSVFAW